MILTVPRIDDLLGAPGSARAGLLATPAGDTGAEDEEGTRKHKKQSLPSALIVSLSLAPG